MRRQAVMYYNSILAHGHATQQSNLLAHPQPSRPHPCPEYLVDTASQSSTASAMSLGRAGGMSMAAQPVPAPSTPGLSKSAVPGPLTSTEPMELSDDDRPLPFPEEAVQRSAL